MLILYAMLGIASFSVMRKTRSIPHNQLRLQVNAWWFIFPVVSLSLLLYPLGPALLALVIAALALRELAVHHSNPRWRFQILCISVLALLIVMSWHQPQHILFVFPCLVAVQLLRFLFQKQANQLLFLLFLFMCHGVSFIIQLMQLPLPPETKLAWLFYLFAMTALNDIGQFITGKFFGKQKIVERISPNKTWQGLAGGVLISLLASVALGSYLELANFSRLVFFALLLSLGGFAGDILFSAAKRFLGIKDFSKLIPGHGGILDRVDSLVVTAPLLYLAIYFYS